MATREPHDAAADAVSLLECHVIVLFGAVGDLSRRKLLPSLYNLHAASMLPRQFSIIGFARTPFKPSNGTDLAALAERKIAVTPLRVDLTDEPTLTRFAQIFDQS